MVRFLKPSGGYDLCISIPISHLLLLVCTNNKEKPGHCETSLRFTDSSTQHIVAHLLVLEAVVVVVDAVEVVAQPRPAVAAHEALLVVVVRPRQDRVRLDQLGAGVARVCNTDTVRIYIY